MGNWSTRHTPPATQPQHTPVVNSHAPPRVRAVKGTDCDYLCKVVLVGDPGTQDVTDGHPY